MSLESTAQKIADGLDKFMSPSTWSRSWRRGFLITLPISGPLYLLAAGSILTIAVVIVALHTLFGGPIDWVIGMWSEGDTR
jgi:hypothetical protein